MSSGYKTIIILVWLTVPIAASLFMRASYANYIDSCNSQRQNCELRAWHVDQYSREFEKLIDEVEQFGSISDYSKWQDMFAGIVQREEINSRKLDLGRPEFYNSTDDQLLVLEIALSDLIRFIDQAALNHLDYIRTADRLERLEETRRDLEANAYYYERIGMEGIYLQIQENLAVVEREIRSRRQLRSDYIHDMKKLLDDAEVKYRRIQRGLDLISDKIREDEDETYRSRLKEHAGRFRLLSELGKIISPD